MSEAVNSKKHVKVPYEGEEKVMYFIRRNGELYFNEMLIGSDKSAENLVNTARLLAKNIEPTARRIAELETK
ncbi:hypothetical protein B0W47_00645 [Komagataeibacter nataicola]|uniref:Uncharacterized protein n=1 Tax=Komagataeibacter nataicola TaxID=265960 RepID=A0A9N7CEV1_9PROT|nr:hypothetical protein [Komagataeibacter nataicola]AQU86210.1 hypothetical protein B0W47_00645 [Komagataeibacter nataicola]PYD65344.1 hypothetical protein CDI09_14150 [Komagataeibacter nataicola]WNM08388.1 hypothetical protein RI056_16245 [Komagataeibacter nataicola]GBR23088.1 hypothetical protein AA0616_2440 [Komagataeibacter nataicola NRIC 0616]